MNAILRATAFAVMLFFIVLGFVIGARMDQTTIALLGGTAIGLLIVTPLAAMVTYLAIRRHDEVQSLSQHTRSTREPSPPQYWITPQVPVVGSYQPKNTLTLPTSQVQSPYVMPYTLPPRRKFYLIGGDGFASEIETETHQNFESYSHTGTNQ
jgi:hypothetical protein